MPNKAFRFVAFAFTGYTHKSRYPQIQIICGCVLCGNCLPRGAARRPFARDLSIETLVSQHHLVRDSVSALLYEETSRFVVIFDHVPSHTHIQTQQLITKHCVVFQTIQGFIVGFQTGVKFRKDRICARSPLPEALNCSSTDLLR